MKKKILAPNSVCGIAGVDACFSGASQNKFAVTGHAEGVTVFVGETYIHGAILFEREVYVEGVFFKQFRHRYISTIPRIHT